MAFIASVLTFDISFIICTLVFAYLSKKMGEALKIRPYYIIFYIAGFAAAAAGGIDIAVRAGALVVSADLSVLLRCTAGLAAVGVCLRYWKWLFSEFFIK